MGVIILVAILAAFIAGFMAACTVLKAIAGEAALSASIEGIEPSLKEEGFIALLKHAGKQRLLRLQLILLFRFGRRSRVETDDTGEAALTLLEEPVVAPPEPVISLTAGLVVDCVEEEVPHTPCADCGVEECGDYTPSPSPANVGEDEGIEIFQLEAELEEECQLLAAEAWELAGKLEQLQLETTPSPEEEEDDWTRQRVQPLTPEIAQEFWGEAAPSDDAEGEEQKLVVGSNKSPQQNKESLEQQLRSEIINGELWEAVETFRTLRELGEYSNLLYIVKDLQEFPAWDLKEVAPNQALEEFVPVGTDSHIKKEAARLFLRMAVHNYRRGELRLTAAFIEAAYNALHGNGEMKYYTWLPRVIWAPFFEGLAARELSCVWNLNFD